MPSKIQLTGGSFQDAEGNVLANGYLKLKLSQDASVTGVGTIASGIEVTISLDASGNVKTIPAQYIWANDQMTPTNTFYRVTGFTAQGQPAWGPNNQQVTGSGGTFDCGTWIPNQLFYWSPPLTGLQLETNGVANGSQLILNLKNGTNITLTDDGSGGITITGPSVPTVLTPYIDVAGFFPGLMGDNQTLLHYEIRHNCTFPTNLSGSKCAALTAATASTTITIKHNGVSVGTMVFGVGGTVAALTLTTFNAVVGDYLDFIGPATADVTLSDVAFTVVATRTS